MDYEKKYKEAVAELSRIANEPNGDGVTLEKLERIFPELAESEDERKRKAIITLLQEVETDEDYCGTNHIEEYIAWLEKQGKRNLIEWGEEDLSMLGNIRSIIEKYAFSQSAVDVNGELCEKEYIDADIWLKSLPDRVQPQNTWKPSEEQMKALRCFSVAGVITDPEDSALLNSLCEQLMKLREE